MTYEHFKASSKTNENKEMCHFAETVVFSRINIIFIALDHNIVIINTTKAKHIHWI